MTKSFGIKSAMFAVLVALAACNDFENPNAVVTTADMQADASADTQADNGQATDAAQDATQPVDTQQVEVAQEVTSVDAGPKPECTKDADCNDNNPCTVDVCGNGAVCVHVATSATCDDGNACTDNDLCVNGACKGLTKNCDDSNLCTDDFCVAGSCVHGVNTAPCDDGNVCTKIDYCKGGSCQSGEWLTCEDKNPCTYDECIAATGCVNGSVNCDDNDPCTTDNCDNYGNCQNAQKSCDDGKPYTYDWCDASGWNGQPGQCVYENKWGACTKDSDCEDGNACTIEVCDGLKGTCKWVSKNCNDYNPCTTDSCVPAKGCVVMVDSCDDFNPNTTDSCDKNGACVHTPISTPPVVVPPTSGTTIKVEISCGASACEVHPYFGADVGGKSFDNMGPASSNGWYTTDLPKSQLCVWGMEVAARLASMPSLPWFGCDAGAPSLSTVTVKVNGVVVPGVLTKHPYTCSGGGEGNLAYAKTVFGCP